MTDSDTSDSWQKLEDDLQKVIDYSNSLMYGTPVCAYVGMQDTDVCTCCKFSKGDFCASSMCSDILNRIRNLKGETNDC